jgi:hypothetical protein
MNVPAWQGVPSLRVWRKDGQNSRVFRDGV